MNSRARAKRLLWHYLSFLALKAGQPLDADCHGEIDEIVDMIVDAAVEQHEELLAEREELYGAYWHIKASTFPENQIEEA